MRNWLREMRVAKNLTQHDVGAAVGVSDVAVTHWENGRNSPSYDKMCSLADLLGREVLAHFEAEARARGVA